MLKKNSFNVTLWLFKLFVNIFLLVFTMMTLLEKEMVVVKDSNNNSKSLHNFGLIHRCNSTLTPDTCKYINPIDDKLGVLK